METIKEDYVSFETAKLLKDKGFNYPCRAVYSPKGTVKHYLKEAVFVHNLKGHKKLCPTLQMAMRWLREVHNLHIDVDPSEGDWNPTVLELEDWSCVVKPGDEIPIQDSYEEACEVAIKYTLENLI